MVIDRVAHVPAMKNHVVVVVDLLSNPKNERYCLDHLSTILNHQKRYLCTMHHLCALGIVSPKSDCVNPTLLCYHQNNS